MILEEAEKRLKEKQNIVTVTFPDDIELTVCGDTHG